MSTGSSTIKSIELKIPEMLYKWEVATDMIGCTNKKYKKSLFGGCYYNKYGERVYIKEIIYNNPAIIVFWSDNTKTTSKCDERDNWDTEKGVALCVLKKLMGGDFVADLLKDWGEPEEGKSRKSLADVRVSNKKKD